MRVLAIALSMSLLAACSSSSDGSSGGSTGGSIEAFSKYCTGTLKTEQKLEAASGGGGWVGNGTKAPAGTVFLLSADFGTFGGYVIGADGKPSKIDADFTKGLVKDTDFTTDCVADPKEHQSEVLLADATLFPKEDLSGTACTLPKATQLHNYSLSGGSAVTTMSSQEIKATCGLDTAYSSNAYYGALVPRN
jgi:hypothetical protein